MFNKRVYFNGAPYFVVEVLNKDKLRIRSLLFPKIVRIVYIGDVTYSKG